MVFQDVQLAGSGRTSAVGEGVTVGVGEMVGVGETVGVGEIVGDDDGDGIKGRVAVEGSGSVGPVVDSFPVRLGCEAISLSGAIVSVTDGKVCVPARGEAA
jgi:hypothetical protein